MTESSDVQRDLALLEVELRKLEAEYTMYFNGRLAKPPWEARNRVQRLVRRLDDGPMPNYGDRFRFGTLQARLVAYDRLWERTTRMRDEGRTEQEPAGQRAEAPRAQAPAEADRASAPATSDGTLHVATIRDPVAEATKLRELYDRLIEARRAAGEERVPFQQFSELVRHQMTRLRKAGGDHVAFRLAVKDGRVSFTARSVGKPKGPGAEGDS